MERAFLEASKKLQDIYLDVQDETESGVDSKWKNLLKETLEKLGTHYGYFIEIDPNKKEVKYFIRPNVSNKKHNEKDTQSYIPYFPSLETPPLELYNILENSKKRFKTILDSPKTYQHLPIQGNKSTDTISTRISSKYLNCYISNKIVQENDYYVTFFDEILFFQYAYCLMESKTSDFFEKYSMEKKHLFKYLLKFALSVEHKISKNELHTYLGNDVSDKYSNWGQEFEKNTIRQSIDELVNGNIGNIEWENKCLDLTNGIIKALIEEYKNDFQLIDSINGLSDTQIIEFITRFDINASFEIKNSENKLIPRDIFVFPLYTEVKPVCNTESVLTDKNTTNIHSPVLLVLYIKTLHEIVDDENIFDETTDSIHGFHFTKEITRLFADKIKDDYLQKEKQFYAIKEAIAEIMSRSLSHNIGSHVLFKVTNDTNLSGEKSRHLFGFLQKRMEFIANGPYPVFQSFHQLFAEILPLYINEDNKRKDCILLFDYISGNDKIKSSEIKFYCINKPDDFIVSIPNGTLGFQALYILFENIIRNSVKHNTDFPKNTDGKEELQYSVEITVDEKYNDFYKVVVSDNFGKISRGNLSDTINQNMNEPILDDAKKLRPNYWGLLEMKICATFLLGFPIERIDDANEDNEMKINGINRKYPPALTAQQDSEQNLKYTFYLQKPKIAALKKTIQANGITEKGFEKINDENAFQKSGSNHLFAVFDNEQDAKNHELSTNQRSVFISSKNAITENDLWKTYVERWNLSAYKIINPTSSNIKSEIEITIQSQTKRIIFGDHNQWYEEQNGNLAPDIIYYEPISGKSITNEAIVDKIKTGLVTEKLKAQIIEMAFTGIIILDERIQELFEIREYESNYSNLFIPPSKTNSLYELNADAIVQWINEIISGLKDDVQINYFIVHRSLKLDAEKLNQHIKTNTNGDTKLVYTSGGGIPTNLKKGDYYLPFDVLKYCLIDVASKYALVDTLRMIRKYNYND